MRKRRDNPVEATILWQRQALPDHYGALPRLKPGIAVNTIAPFDHDVREWGNWIGLPSSGSTTLAASSLSHPGLDQSGDIRT